MTEYEIVKYTRQYRRNLTITRESTFGRFTMNEDEITPAAMFTLLFNKFGIIVDSENAEYAAEIKEYGVATAIHGVLNGKKISFDIL